MESAPGVAHERRRIFGCCFSLLYFEEVITGNTSAFAGNPGSAPGFNERKSGNTTPCSDFSSLLIRLNKNSFYPTADRLTRLNEQLLPVGQSMVRYNEDSLFLKSCICFSKYKYGHELTIRLSPSFGSKVQHEKC